VINMIVVKVNGEPILLSELQTLQESQVEILRQQMPEEEVQAQLQSLRAALLTGMIDERMMLQRADRLGIVADANQVDRQIEQLRASNNLTTEEEFAAALAQLGMTVDDVRVQMRKSIRQQRLVFEEVNRNLIVSEQEILSYYNGHQDQFEAPEQVRLQQLVFLTSAGDAATLQQQAEAALGELRGGVDFDAVAAKYTNAMPFADEAFIAVHDLNETLAVAVPSLAENTFSDVLQSDFGFQIVRVVARQAQSLSELANVREQIRNQLLTEKSDKRMSEYMGGLRKGSLLEIFDPAFSGIEESWKAAGQQQEAAEQEQDVGAR